MKKDLFNGKRLKIARVYRGKSVDILAKETNINKKDILAFEDNKYKPTLENALKLSNILHFPREYFYDNENIKVVVEDYGKGIEDVEEARQPMFTSKPELERSGMGFSFMESFMDDVQVASIIGEGTKVIMTKKIEIPK